MLGAVQAVCAKINKSNLSQLSQLGIAAMSIDRVVQQHILGKEPGSKKFNTPRLYLSSLFCHFIAADVIAAARWSNVSNWLVPSTFLLNIFFITTQHNETAKAKMDGQLKMWCNSFCQMPLVHGLSFLSCNLARITIVFEMGRELQKLAVSRFGSGVLSKMAAVIPAFLIFHTSTGTKHLVY